ncbi:MAG: type II toxin-antitoxin system VapB family antitoxin [Cyanobacteria bacterium P01_D01_bin.105]
MVTLALCGMIAPEADEALSEKSLAMPMQFQSSYLYTHVKTIPIALGNQVAYLLLAWEGRVMNTIKLSTTDNVQTVSLPQEFQVAGDEVYIKKIGNAIILIPKDDPWQALIQSLDLFSADFMEQRSQPGQSEREALFE